MSVKIFGTIGPSCDNSEILCKMFEAGMTGIRINLSHVMLADCSESISRIHNAAKAAGVTPEILIDMQGPELRIGRFQSLMHLDNGDTSFIGAKGIPLDRNILEHLDNGTEILFDDGKLLAEVISKESDYCEIRIKRGGVLTQRKSITVVGKDIMLPALTHIDIANLQVARGLGITGIMQPFVRSRDDLMAVHKALEENGCRNLKVFAKIENQAGIDNVKTFSGACDEVVIARGDLGNSMPLWELPRVQKHISKICNRNDMPFMVVTQMLSSMENSEVPTRAEISDIFNAVIDGASSVMVTGETAIGKFPVEVMRFLSNTVKEAVEYRKSTFKNEQ